MRYKKAKIYNNWLTLADFEGEAYLIKKLSDNDIGEHWEVQFLSEPDQTYQRWIKK